MCLPTKPSTEDRSLADDMKFLIVGLFELAIIKWLQLSLDNLQGSALTQLHPGKIYLA